MSQPQEYPPLSSEKSPVMVIVLILVTCGLYLFYWYYCMYRDLKEISGRTPTGNEYFIDLLILIPTCGLWNLYVDYKISERFNQLQERFGVTGNDTRTLVLILDIAGIITGYVTGIIANAIHQDQWNRIVAAGGGAQLAPTTRPSPAGPSGSSGDAGPSPYS